MEYQVELSKNAIGSNFNELVELEKNMQDQIDRVLGSCEWIHRQERFPTNVYPRKDGEGVRLSITMMIEPTETVFAPRKTIIHHFEAEGFKVTI